MINIPNYQITQQIYESTNSLIYRALRNEDNQAVIFKVLKEDYPTPEELTRYRLEYEIIRSLADLEGKQFDERGIYAKKVRGVKPVNLANRYFHRKCSSLY